MGKAIKRLPDSELEIMMLVWEANGPVNSAYIFERLKDKKDWKPTSVLTFLSRLVDKGFLACRREGKANLYSIVIGEREYLEKESRTFLQKLYGNSVTSFVSALYSDKTISDEDLTQLREFIDSAEQSQRTGKKG